jgi:hypothetical protein
MARADALRDSCRRLARLAVMPGMIYADALHLPWKASARLEAGIPTKYNNFRQSSSVQTEISVI